MFARAPVISRLLPYLVDGTIAGVPLKSYTFAIEALGKGEGDLADADNGNRNAWKHGARSADALETARLIKLLGRLLSDD